MPSVKKHLFGCRIKTILIPIKIHENMNPRIFCITACVAQLCRRQQQTKSNIEEFVRL
jgi:hypothetical protein